ncbi:MAG: hypothetical protein ACOVLB_07500 [Candidatus Nanopelagicus sp.]
MARPLKIAKSSTIDIGFPNDGTSDNDFTGNGIGVVGGNNVSLNVLVRVKIGAELESDGYILRQKGKRKFLVTDGTNVGICVLADTDDDALADDTMTVTVTDDAEATFRLSTITNHWGLDFAENKYVLSFFATAAAGSIPGTAYAQVAVRNND